MSGAPWWHQPRDAAHTRVQIHTGPGHIIGFITWLIPRLQWNRQIFYHLAQFCMEISLWVSLCTDSLFSKKRLLPKIILSYCFNDSIWRIPTRVTLGKARLLDLFLTQAEKKTTFFVRFKNCKAVLQHCVKKVWLIQEIRWAWNIKSMFNFFLCSFGDNLVIPVKTTTVGVLFSEKYFKEKVQVEVVSI